MPVVKLFNAGVTGLFDLVFWPLRGLPPLVALAVVSLLAGVLMLWVFGLVSNQAAIHTIRDRIRGNLIGVGLFGDDLGVLFRLQGRLLWDNLLFLKYAMVPLLIMIVPVFVILVQLDLRFGARPLEPGRSALVKVTVRDAATILHGVTLEVPDGLSIETPAVRAAALHEVSWRIRPQRTGRYRIVVRTGEQVVEKELRAGGGWGATSTRRTGGSVWDMLLHPGEAPVPGGDVVSVDVGYAPLEMRLIGWSVNWLVGFFVLSLVSGFALRRVLGVEI